MAGPEPARLTLAAGTVTVAVTVIVEVLRRLSTNGFYHDPHISLHYRRGRSRKARLGTNGKITRAIGGCGG